MHKETEKALVKKHVTESKAASKRERKGERGGKNERKTPGNCVCERGEGCLRGDRGIGNTGKESV